jgi:hypothetical protein
MRTVLEVETPTAEAAGFYDRYSLIKILGNLSSQRLINVQAIPQSPRSYTAHSRRLGRIDQAFYARRSPCVDIPTEVFIEPKRLIVFPYKVVYIFFFSN